MTVPGLPCDLRLLASPSTSFSMESHTSHSTTASRPTVCFSLPRKYGHRRTPGNRGWSCQPSVDLWAAKPAIQSTVQSILVKPAASDDPVEIVCSRYFTLPCKANKSARKVAKETYRNTQRNKGPSTKGKGHWQMSFSRLFA